MTITLEKQSQKFVSHYDGVRIIIWLMTKYFIFDFEFAKE